MSGTEFRMVAEAGDSHPYDTYEEAYEAMANAAKQDIATHGEEDARDSGALNPYGYSIEILEDGEDITENWKHNYPHKPLALD